MFVLYVTTDIKPCSACKILHLQMEKIVLSCSTNSAQWRKAHIRWESARWDLTGTHTSACKKNTSWKYVVHHQEMLQILCMLVLDFPERGVVSAAGREARPCVGYSRYDAAEIHPHAFCQEEFYQIQGAYNLVSSSLQRIPGQVICSSNL